MCAFENWWRRPVFNNRVVGSIPFKAAKPKGPTGVTISRRLAEQTLGKTRFSSFSASEDYHQRPRNFAIDCLSRKSLCKRRWN